MLYPSQVGLSRVCKKAGSSFAGSQHLMQLLLINCCISSQWSTLELGALLTRQLFNPIHAVVIVLAEQKLRATLEGERLSHQPQGSCVTPELHIHLCLVASMVCEEAPQYVCMKTDSLWSPADAHLMHCL